MRHAVARAPSAPIVTKKKPHLRVVPTTPYKGPRHKRKLPSAEFAFKRLLDLIEEIGRDLKHEYGWKARAAEQLGLNPQSVYSIVGGWQTGVGLDTIDKICDKLRCTVAEFFDEDY